MTNTRRDFVKKASATVGALGLSGLLQASHVEKVEKKKIVCF